MQARPLRSVISIAGIVPLTTIDFPNHLSAVIFCQGCPFRCSYCHNPSLIPRDSNHLIPWLKVYNFLLDRVGLLEAIVFSGGEPTLQSGLPEAIKAVKDLGFKIGLHTAGSYPAMLEKILLDLDWVGMDLKAPFDEYESITKIPKSGDRALASAKLILNSNVPYEFRTTVHPKLLNSIQLSKLRHSLIELGVTNYKLQEFRKDGCIEPTL